METLTRDKNAYFDQLQLRQAELESSQSHLESLQSLNTELQYQLRESQDRISLLKEELVEAHRGQESGAREPMTSSKDVAQLLSTAEAKYEAKLTDLKRALNVMEKERSDSEAEWSRKLREKTKETNDMRQVLGSATMSKEQEQGVIDRLKAEIERLREEAQRYQKQVSDIRSQLERVMDTQVYATFFNLLWFLIFVFRTRPRIKSWHLVLKSQFLLKK